ncbi:hypothetical protein D3C75_1152300 [compost metagenome]
MKAFEAAAAASAPSPATTSGGTASRTLDASTEIRKQTTPARPAAPLLSLARPTATPTANSRPRLAKTACPAAEMKAMSSRSG